MLNGDHGSDVRLTARGVEQARALGRAVGPVDIAVHTASGRTPETADNARPGDQILVVPELNEISYGSFAFDRLNAWVREPVWR